MKLIFGVVEIPYVTKLSAEEKRTARGRSKKKPRQSSRATLTTGDVAGFLEARYHLMRTFYYARRRDIVHVMEDRLQGAIENVMMGKPPSDDIFAELSPIEEMFRRDIDERKYDGVIRGVPTLASLLGINHRLKNPYKIGNPVRPSFFDTGTYSKSFKAWTEK